MKLAVLAMAVLIVGITGCTQNVYCGKGTIARPMGDVSRDGGGYLVRHDGTKYVDENGEKYDKIVCKPAEFLVVCDGAWIVDPGVAVEPDGPGYWVKHDNGTGESVEANEFVPAERLCQPLEPAPPPT